MTVDSVLRVIERYIGGDALVIAAFGDWVEYDGDGWKAVRVDTETAMEALSEYVGMVQQGEMTDEEALMEFLNDIGTAGSVESLTGVSISEAMPSYNE